ncbi:MAG: MarR family winged helix-turn-helix transcriptional regulator [Lachnotalea sp.]
MKISGPEMEKEISKFIDEIKDILSPELWGNLLLDCSKNEVLVLWLLYQQAEVNMSQIAEYIHTPLNTATGVIARMEKKKLVVRERSVEDKRIVTIQLDEQGKLQMQAIMKEFSYYALQVGNAFTKEEIKLFFQLINKLLDILKQERKQDIGKNRVRKITIE